MSYLIIKENENSIIDKLGENIYSKNFSKTKQSNTVVLGKSKYDFYCCSMGANREVNIVYKTSSNSLVHLQGIDGSFTASTILEDFENKYNINNIQILSSESSYLFYCAKNQNDGSYDLIFHTLSINSNESPQSLITLPELGSKYLCEIYSNTLYLVALIKNNSSFELNCYKYHIPTQSWLGYETIITSELPISDYSFYIQNDQLHITYVLEYFAHMSLYHYSFNHKSEKSPVVYHKKSDPDSSSHAIKLYSSGSNISPKIFSYKSIIWLNILNSGQLYFCFSKDNGKTFSTVKPCTLQTDNIKEFKLLYHSLELWGSDFFGYINTYPQIPILSQIDLDNILCTSENNFELNELVSNQSLLEDQTEYIQELECELKLLQQNQTKIINQYNQLSEFTKTVQSEGKKWRKKYNSISSKKSENQTKPKSASIPKTDIDIINIDKNDTDVKKEVINKDVINETATKNEEVTDVITIQDSSSITEKQIKSSVIDIDKESAKSEDTE